jgi:hypothetical protein
MDIEEEPKQERNLKKVALDILEVMGEVVGLAASPSLLWLGVIWNSSGGSGFDGYPNKPSGTFGTGPAGAQPINVVENYKTETIYYDPNIMLYGIVQLPSLGLFKDLQSTRTAIDGFSQGGGR